MRSSFHLLVRAIGLKNELPAATSSDLVHVIDRINVDLGSWATSVQTDFGVVHRAPEACHVFFPHDKRDISGTVPNATHRPSEYSALFCGDAGGELQRDRSSTGPSSETTVVACKSYWMGPELAAKNKSVSVELGNDL
jgi:hypothetical protein